jgi:hypothetical protein
LNVKVGVSYLYNVENLFFNVEKLGLFSLNKGF